MMENPQLTKAEIQRLREAFFAGANYGAGLMERAWVRMHPDIGTRPFILFRRSDFDERFAEFLARVETNLGKNRPEWFKDRLH